MRKWLTGALCLSAFCLLFASGAERLTVPVAGRTSTASAADTTATAPQTRSRRKSGEEIQLIHSDVLYKNYQDVRADVLVGNVRLYHDGMYLDCDSARFYKDDNTFNAYGNVKMMQGDTLTLTSETLLYDGPMMQAHAQGNAVLTHRKTRLVTDVIDYDRLEGVGFYPQHGTLYDEDNVLNSDYGQYTPSRNEAVFKDNVVLDNPKFNLKTNELYYYSDTKIARIMTETNIVSSDSTFVYALRGDYDTRTGNANLMDRSHIYKDMRDIVGDSLYFDADTKVSEAFGNVVLTDVENSAMLTGHYCRYEDSTGVALATDSAVMYEFSEQDTLYVHGDTLKMVTYNQHTDSVYRDLFAYHKVRMFRNDFQGVCDSLVSHQRDSCTYMYGQPIIWNEAQQVFGEEIRVYNNDSTIDYIHIINQAMTIERLDSASYNQVMSREMFSYFKDGVIERSHARGNVYVSYFMEESDGARIGMNYTETPELILYMQNKKVHKIWMSTASGVMYPPVGIPAEKRYLPAFAWFDYIRPKDKDDIFGWKEKNEDQKLKTTEKKVVPRQSLDDLR